MEMSFSQNIVLQLFRYKMEAVIVKQEYNHIHDLFNEKCALVLQQSEVVYRKWKGREIPDKQ